MKTKQRSALTLERQQRLATGGGPPIQNAQVDPDIMLIAPSLNTTAPILFSSNMDEAEVVAKRDLVNMMECEDYSNFEALFEDSDNDESVVNDVMTSEENFVEASTSGGTASESRKKYGKGENTTIFIEKSTFDVTGMIKPTVASLKSRKRRGKENTCSEEKKSYTTKRLTKIIQQEEKLFCQKLNHEQEIHDLTMAHLKQKYALEIRTAVATADLAELICCV